MRFAAVVWTSCLVLLVVSCSSPPEEEEPVLPAEYERVEQGGQLPEEVVREASSRYGGAMAEDDATGATHFGTRLSLVLGPVVHEQDPPGGRTSDAGRKIREVISEQLTASGEIALADAPEERFVDDSPRPDLARKGIRYVIKGTTSYTESTGAFTVFLRAVATRTGAVAMVTSARDQSSDQAARTATDLLIGKLKGDPQ